MADTEVDVTDTIDFDRSVLGVEVEVGSHEVTADEIIAYATALGETNPLHVDEAAAKAGPYGALIAPPLFYNVLRVGAGPDPKVNFGTTGFDAGQHVEFVEPIKAGETIHAKAKVHNVYAKTGRTGTMVFAVRRTTFSNQNGELKVVLDRINVRRDIRQ